jgi:hypothetical protein
MVILWILGSYVFYLTLGEADVLVEEATGERVSAEMVIIVEIFIV